MIYLATQKGVNKAESEDAILIRIVAPVRSRAT